MKITPPTDNSATEQKVKNLEVENESLAKQIERLKTSELPLNQSQKEKIIQQLKITEPQLLAQIEKASDYLELVQIQQANFQTKLKKAIDQKKSSHNLNWVLGTLSVASLLLLAYLLIMKSQPKIGPKRKKSKG